MLRVLLLSLLLVVSLFASVGQIVSLKGDASILRDNGTLQAKLGERLHPNDIIKTTDNSRLQILFKDETVITLGKKSRFSIDDYVLDTKKKSNSRTQFQFLTGKFKVISGGIAKINRKGFKLKTKSASIGIRGTQISMNLTPTNEFIACDLGEIEVSLINSNVAKVLKTGESISISIKAKKTVGSSSTSSSSSNTVSQTKVDTKYDDWSTENSSISKAVEDAFDKGHTQSYSATSIDGEINEKQAGGGYTVKTFDESDVTFANSTDMTIDFGKGKNDTTAVQIGNISILGGNTVKNIHGKINTNYEIELTYDTNSTSDIAVKQSTDVVNPSSDSAVMNFKNTDLDVEGKDLGLETTADLEEVRIKEIQFEAQ